MARAKAKKKSEASKLKFFINITGSQRNGVEISVAEVKHIPFLIHPFTYICSQFSKLLELKAGCYEVTLTKSPKKDYIKQSKEIAKAMNE